MKRILTAVVLSVFAFLPIQVFAATQGYFDITNKSGNTITANASPVSNDNLKPGSSFWATSQVSIEDGKDGKLLFNRNHNLTKAVNKNEVFSSFTISDLSGGTLCTVTLYGCSGSMNFLCTGFFLKIDKDTVCQRDTSQEKKDKFYINVTK